MRVIVPMFVSTMVFAMACGGSNTPPANQTAASTTTSAAGSSAAGGASGASSGAAPTSAGSAGPSTTTTTTLSGNGDLNGSKLTTASSSSIQTTSPDANAGHHQQEPGRSVKDIATIIVSHRDEARKCYDDGLKTYPGVEGDLDVKFTIDPKGNVSDAMVNDEKSSIHASAIGDCVVGVIKKIHFAESQKGFETRAHYPFNFHPNQTKGSSGSPPPQH